MRNKISYLATSKHKTYLFLIRLYFCNCINQICKCRKSSTLVIIITFYSINVIITLDLRLLIMIY